MNAYLKLSLTAPLWASAFIAGQVVVQRMPPMTAAFLRFFFASMVMVFFLWQRHRQNAPANPLMPARWRDGLMILLLAFLGIFLYNATFMIGLQYVPGTRAATIIPTNPIFLVLLAWLIYREPLGLLRIFGTLLAVLGALIVVTHGNLAQVLSSFTIYDLWLFAAIACWIAYVIISKPLLKIYGSLSVNTWAFVAGTLMLGASLPLLMHLPQAPPMIFPETIWQGSTLLILFLMGFGASALAFIWYFEGQQEVGVIRASVFISAIPVMAMMEAFVFLHQAIYLSDWMGALLVGLGIYCVNRPVPRH